MKHPIEHRLELVLEGADPCGALHVDFTAFLQFNFRIDCDIETLVARWERPSGRLPYERLIARRDS